MRARFRPVQAEARPAADDVALVIEVVPDHVAQRQGARHTVHQRNGVHPEGGLRLGVFVQLVQHHLGHRVATQLHHHADAVAAALVAQVRDLLQHAVVGELGHLPQHLRLVHLVRQLGEHDGVAAVLEGLVVREAPHHHSAAAGAVGIAHARQAHDLAGGREVRRLHELHEAVGVDGGIIDHRDAGINDLAQIVRRDVGGHAHGDPGGAVHQQVGHTRRQHRGLAPAVVVGGDGLDGVLVDVPQHLRRIARQARLGVPHGGSRELLRAEVALAVHRGVPAVEVLGQAHQGVVDGRVAVGVIFAHDRADDVRALHVPAVRLQAPVVHGEQHAAVHRLQAVTHVRQSSPHDHAHRVVEVRRAHLLGQLAWLDPPVAIDRHLRRPGTRRSARCAR